MPAGHPLQITVSIGMVTCPGGSGHSLADLLKLADLAVYKAKMPAVTGSPRRNLTRRTIRAAELPIRRAPAV